MGEVKLKKEHWSQEQDELLLNTVIHYLRSGKKKKEAFQEFAKNTGRTTAATVVRFNSRIKNNYSAELKDLNFHSRKEVVLLNPSELVESDTKGLNWGGVLDFLNHQAVLVEKLKQQNIEVYNRLIAVTEENSKNKEELEQMKKLNLYSNTINISSLVKLLDQAQALGIIDKTILSEV